MRRATSAILGFGLAVSATRPARAEKAQPLDWDKPVRCMRDPSGKEVRVQCDPVTKRCLVAPNATTDGGELRRVRACEARDSDHAYAALERAGAKFVPAIAETPPGFARSKEGRAYQVQFDLLNRVYVGAAWAPTFLKPDARLSTPPGFPLARGRVEIGMHASVLSPKGRSRHDFRVLEGTASFRDLQLSGLVFAYDYQHVHRRPAFWITSFFGEPQHHPVPIPIGWGFRTVKVEDRPPGSRRALDLEAVESHISWNPLQSRDLYSHLRLEAGADVGARMADRTVGPTVGSWYVGPTAAVRARLSLDGGGLHYLFMNVDYGRPMLVAGERAGRSAQRVVGAMAYEGVLIAINDQPISVRLSGTGAVHDDPVTQTRSVEFGANAGLRFSFWAPPRSFEPLPDVEDP